MSLRTGERDESALCFICATLLLAQAPVTPASITITHVTVIDTANGSAQGDMTVVIGGNRIIRMGDSGTVALPRAVPEVDGRGKFLIPGRWDMHVHVFNTDHAGSDNSSDYSFRSWLLMAWLAFATCGAIRKTSGWLVAGTRRSKLADCSGHR